MSLQVQTLTLSANIDDSMKANTNVPKTSMQSKTVFNVQTVINCNLNKHFQIICIQSAQQNRASVTTIHCENIDPGKNASLVKRKL